MKHFIIPDTQCKPDQDFSYLTDIGKYIVAKQPDVIVQIGDFADMPSLSSYDVGTKGFEGRRYSKDIQAAQEAMNALIYPIYEFNRNNLKNKKKLYRPRFVLTLGNHEHRIEKAINKDAKLDGLMSLQDLEYDQWGWEVVPFKQTIVIDGVAYVHYLPTGQRGMPCSTANAQLNKSHKSIITGHQQGLQIAMGRDAEGKRLTSVIAGSCYLHDEGYMGPVENKHWRGCLMLHNVQDGEFDLMPVSLDYIRERAKR